MPKKTTFIPVKSLKDEFQTGIAIGQLSVNNLHLLKEVEHSHRHDFHFFFLQEKGSSVMEIDFERYNIKKSSLLYIHPDQVHRTLKIENASIYILAISNENLHPKYLKLLEDVTPTRPLALTAKNLPIIAQSISLCISILERTHEKLYVSLLKDSCNVLVALIISQLLGQTKPKDKLTRFDIITTAFKSALDGNFRTVKRPANYARTLNISVPYLNECVKGATGFPVSHHILQRVILEAKRLLYHSNKSVKEIASELGYEEYAYFSRLFTKATGVTASTFRNRNFD